MFKELLLLLGLSISLLAAPATTLNELQKLSFEDAFENKVSISNTVSRIIVSFDKKGNALMADFLNTQPKGFLDIQKAVYIGDIHKMPAIITYMFARPKMKKYNFTIFLYEGEDLASYIPVKEDQVTVLLLDEKGNITETFFTHEPQKAFQ